MEGGKVLRQHEKLEAWRDAMELVTSVYRIAGTFPAEERFALTSQLKRACVSVPSNIAEGAARGSHKEFLRFLGIAHGSLAELETHLQIAERLGYLEDASEAYYLAKQNLRQAKRPHSDAQIKNRGKCVGLFILRLTSYISRKLPTE